MSHDALTTSRADSLLPASAEDGASVTLLCAPPGFGKTTIVADWARRIGHGDTAETLAWLNIEDTDDDPVTLTREIVATVTRALGEPAGAAWTGRSPCHPDDPDYLVTTLAAVVDDQPSVVWLVLDDVQRLRSPHSLRALARLLAWLPAKLRLVLCADQELPLGLHQPRVTGRLREIRAADLVLTAHEARKMVAGYGVRLDAGQTEELMRLTEGWPAVVRLMAMATADMADSTDPVAALARLPGTDRGVADFLNSEVLSALTGEQLRFLRCTSVPDDFDAQLAVVLTHSPNAAQVLVGLERTDFFVVRGSGQRYRLHPFIRAYLLADLERRVPATLCRLHRACARWFLVDDVVTSATHARHSGDATLVARLITLHGPELLLRGEAPLVMELADLLPPLAVARADVALVLVLAEMMTGDRAAAELRLVVLGEARAKDTSSRVRDLEVIVRTHWGRLTGRAVPEMDALGARLGTMPGLALPVLALLNRGIGSFWLGRHDEARHDLEQALSIATAQGYEVAVLHCHSYLAGIAAAQGDFLEMRRYAQRAITYAEARGPAHRTDRSFAYAVAAWAEYQFLEQERAVALVAQAVEWLPACTDRIVELCVLALKEIVEFEDGPDPNAALVRLRAIWAQLGRIDLLQPRVVGYEETIEHRMALRLGRTDWAREVQHRTAQRFDDSGEVQMMEARVRMHRGQVTAARTQLGRIVHGAVPSVAVTTLIEAHLMTAVLAERAGDHEQSVAALRAALELAEPRQAVRVFYDAGADVRPLLVAHAGRLGRLDSFVAVVLDALPTAYDNTELTPSEVRLLRELPSLATVEEIAATLFVSVNTVKTHLRHMYRKLGVRSRREAVAAARRCGLL